MNDFTIYEIKSPITPSIFVSSIDGKTWIVPVWVEVPKGTVLSQIKHIAPTYDQFVELSRVKASKGNTVYIISQKGKEYKCTCTGFKFKRNCKHIAEYIFNEKILK